MGADLIGYFLYYPKDTGAKVFKEHAAKLKTLVKRKPTNREKWLDELAKFGVDLGYYDLEETVFDSVRDDLAELGNNGLDLVTRGRDYNYDEIAVNGQKVGVVYAGEMTWGDEPSGLSYQTLKLVHNLGFAKALEQAIRWNKEGTTDVKSTRNRDRHITKRTPGRSSSS
jgi:hypothetical protein